MVKPVLSREERGFVGKERIALYHVKIYQAMQRKRGNVYQGQVLVLKMLYSPNGVNGLIVVKTVFHNCIPVLEVNQGSENVMEMSHFVMFIRQSKYAAVTSIDVRVSRI